MREVEVVERKVKEEKKTKTPDRPCNLIGTNHTHKQYIQTKSLLFLFYRSHTGIALARQGVSHVVVPAHVLVDAVRQEDASRGRDSVLGDPRAAGQSGWMTE